MTDTQTTPLPDDIDEPTDLPSARLDRAADSLLVDGEDRTIGPRPLHEAVHDDALAARDWGRTRVVRLRRSIEDEPMRATLYALGIGLVIGLLMAR